MPLRASVALERKSAMGLFKHYFYPERIPFQNFRYYNT